MVKECFADQSSSMADGAVEGGSLAPLPSVEASSLAPLPGATVHLLKSTQVTGFQIRG